MLFPRDRVPLLATPTTPSAALHIFVYCYSDLSTWLRGKTEELGATEMVRGIPEGVQKQLDDLKVSTCLL